MSELRTNHPVITLTTDFGTQDWFVGVMKGVIANIAPTAQVIDISHSIAPGNIRQGAFVLNQAVHWFPKHSIHVGVVDPGVGTARKAIIIKTECGYFIGPDNGLFSWVTDYSKIQEIFEISAEKLSNKVSSTFHGRDLFAPVAAKLASGQAPSDIGPATDNKITQFDWPKWEMKQANIQGEIMHVDRFGNLITNLPSHQILGKVNGLTLQKTGSQCPISIEMHSTYGTAPEGKLVLISGSTGYLEWAIRDGNAAKVLDWEAGKKFELSRESGF